MVMNFGFQVLLQLVTGNKREAPNIFVHARDHFIAWTRGIARVKFSGAAVPHLNVFLKFGKRQDEGTAFLYKWTLPEFEDNNIINFALGCGCKLIPGSSS